MRGKGFSWRFGVRMLGTLAAPVLVSLTGETFADDPVPPAPLPVAVPALPAIQVLDLHQCREIALFQQPAIAAAQASLSAAIEKKHALDRLRLAAIIQRDLPIRRKQAAVGIDAGAAALSQAEADTLYDVTFSYLSVVYAEQQARVATEALAKLDSDKPVRPGEEALLQLVEKIKTADLRKDLDPKFNLIRVYSQMAKNGQEEARMGKARALSALREAMGVGPDCCLEAGQKELFQLFVVPCKEQIIALAIARRGEMGQAVAAYQATAFEIEAQRSTCFFSGKTFAIGSDIHLYPIPLADHDYHYRPGGVGIEMPAVLAGTRGDRVHQAQLYHERASAVVEKTRNLVAFDAEQTYLRWQEQAQKLSGLEKAAAEAQKAADFKRTHFDPTAKDTATLEDVLNTGFLATNLKLQVNQARYQMLLELVGLERVTAGGYCPGFEMLPSPQMP